MKFSRNTVIAAVAAVLVAAGAAFGLGANAQTPRAAQVIGYSVYAHSHYVLLQQPDGRLRTCRMNRQTPIRRALWECETLDALP
jgi:hypothetical protein